MKECISPFLTPQNENGKFRIIVNTHQTISTFLSLDHIQYEGWFLLIFSLFIAMHAEGER